jgi:antitoxin component YwqK of YwqJK toxin-antitoxin module
MEKVELDLKLGGVTNHIDCYDVPTSIEKGHNWCQILKDSIPFSGYVKQRIVKKDSTVKVFSGILSEGYIMNGSYIEFYYNGKIKQTGQYENNWKVGIWTSYYENGQIEWLGKYIEKNDYPVVEFEYKNNGELEYFNDEEKFMKNLIDKEDAEK